MRTALVERKTGETDIKIEVNLDGTGKADINTGCGFLDHMLTLFTVHGGFDLCVRCAGDTYVDYHHTVEDIGISLGAAFYKALGEKKGICRYGDIILPMDETLILSSVDFSGRSYLGFIADMPSQKVGDFDTELVEEFWLGFVREARCALHIREISGKNTHHIIEGIFKAAARSISSAVATDGRFKDVIPSTKGVL